MNGIWHGCGALEAAGMTLGSIGIIPGAIAYIGWTNIPGGTGIAVG
jgi:hypothetical protein